MPNKILIADDDVELLKAMVKSFSFLPKELDVQVLTVNKGADVLPAIEANPDIKFMFLDIIFENEEEDGLDILAKINQRYPNFKVVMFTAASTPERMMTAMIDLNAYEYIQKPFNLKQLFYMAESILLGRYKPFILKRPPILGPKGG